MPRGRRGSRGLLGHGDQVHLLVVATSERGLAGAFNTNIVRAARRKAAELEGQGKTVRFYIAGKKGRVLRREGLYDSSVKQWRAQIEAGTLGTVSKRRPRAGQSPEQARIAELEKQISKLESDAARKDKVIADRDAALEVMGKGVAFLEALSKKNKG